MQFRLVPIVIGFTTALALVSSAPAHASAASSQAHADGVPSTGRVAPEPRTSPLSDSAPVRVSDGARTWSWKLRDVTRTDNVAGKQVIGRCGATTPGIDCAIEKTVTVRAEIGTDLGISQSGVSGALKLGASTSVSLAVSCRQSDMPAGRSLVARSIGTRYTYRIEKRNWFPPYQTKTSEVLETFVPHKNGVSCGVE